ncbi:MAG TPA: LuxR C-terminal-related transcriptional regulator [Ktedonobacterales bacterium]|nr:LuxR C-terminal-related transcriptional regulator [Ktedonobacterales bacterium]
MPTEIASFIGRETDRAAIQRLLVRTRLLTLTGAGGCGKTRLALRVAADLGRDFPDGVWFVQFAPLADSEQVPRAVATVIGVHGTAGRPLLASLAAALASRRLLLVLDNCEHLIGACARLAETLLRACPRLRILATSRERLRIPGEITWRVPSLALPDAAPLPALEALAQVEAVALFLDRARARRPDFTLTADNAASVAAICQRLEGLPLGIELAAARMGALAPEQIAGRLDDALRLLGGGQRTLPRQETLRATLDWSHALLISEERVLFRRLAVFAGSFGVAAAEHVGGGDGIERDNVLDLLTALVEKSLVEPLGQPGEARFRLLEPVRQYAWARLIDSAEVERTRQQHARYFLHLAETAEPRLMSGARGDWLERLALDQDNLRSALDWSRRATAGSDAELGLRLVGALFWFWSFRGEVSEGLERVSAALARSQEAPAAVRAKALEAEGEYAWLQGQFPRARARLEESVALYRTLDNKRGLAYALQALPMVTDQPEAGAAAAESLRLFAEVGDAWGAAHAALVQSILNFNHGDGDASTVRAGLEGALARWRALGDAWGMAQAHNFLGDLARGQRDDARAAAHYQESLALLRGQGITGTVPSLLHNLGWLALRGSAGRRALRLFRESLSLFRGQGDQRGMAECLAGLAGTLGALKQPDRAARLFGAAEAQLEALGTETSPVNAAEVARGLARVRDQLDGTAFAVAFAAGRELSLEQATAEALALDLPGKPLGSVDEVELTPREIEIAGLVARGVTNRQIGEALSITAGTAGLHVKHILHKLGFTSRAQIASWAVTHGLVAGPDTP